MDDQKTQRLFLGLKQLALAMLIMGVVIILMITFLDLSKTTEMMFIFLFSLSCMGFIVARTISIKQYIIKKNDRPDHIDKKD